MVRWVRRYYKDKAKADKLAENWRKEGWAKVSVQPWYGDWVAERLTRKATAEEILDKVGD